MSDTEYQRPEGTEPENSDEYGFDPERDPLNKDEEQAEASQYGIYGYADQPGKSFQDQEEIHRRGAESEATAAARHEARRSTSPEEEGGQAWDETEHGAGIAQPMEEPQRSASRSSAPSDS